MDRSLLIDTKLRPPRLREGHLTRPRLLAQLDRGLNGDLILISAPAGYGKTTLAADWLNPFSMANGQRPHFNVAWLSLDKNDNDLGIFLQYVIAAVQSAFPQAQPCAHTQSLLDATQPLPLEVITNNLINDLAALPNPLLLALDDYHLITDQTCRQVMAQLVRHLPPTLRLLLITRIDPALPLLARLRAQQRITEIRADDLRFLRAEARTVLEQTSGTRISIETAVTLEAQTEGWIIGLQMAGISLRGKADQAAVALAFEKRGNRLVMGFLLDEVLAHQPRPTLDFLLQTSILEQFCAPLCEAVTNSSGSSSLSGESFLDRLVQANLFLVPLDEQGEWYRYHHLFQELLRRRLVSEWPVEAIGRLHHRAAMWLAEHGFIEEALRHHLAAGDTEAVVALIEANRHKALNREDFRTLERWLGILPKGVVEARPSLLQLKAWILRLRFNQRAIPPILQEAERLLALDVVDAPFGVNPDILRGERDALWSEVLFWEGDFQRCLTHAQSAQHRLPLDCYFARGIGAVYLCFAFQAIGQQEFAITLLNEMLDDERLQHHAFKSRQLIALGGIYGKAGDLEHLEQVGRSLLQFGQAENKPLSISWAHYFLGHVYYHWNRLDDASAHWSVVPTLRYHINFRTYHEVMLGLALVQQINGEDEQAKQTISALSQVVMESGENYLMPEVDAFRARLALQRGDVAVALQWAETTTGPAQQPMWFWETSDLTRIKILISAGTADSLQRASELLQTSQDISEAAHDTKQLIEIWALWALIERAQGKTEAALASLNQAVRMARPGGYIRLFVDLGAPMAAMLHQLSVRGVSSDYIGRILTAFPPDQSGDPEALTDRELEILALLQQHLSDKEIAGQLVLSVHTVKRHNHHIYHKLGVNGRRQAVDRAKALNLLP